MEAENYIAGRNPVLEALKSEREIDKLLVGKGSNQGSINKILGIAKERKIVIQYVDRNKLDTISDSKVHQGIVAVAAAHSYKTVDDMIKLAEQRQEDPFIIILDEIEDPHNLGAIMRTAECAGAHGIIIPKRRAVGLTSVVAKTSAGAIEYMPVAKVTNISVTIDDLKARGLWIYGADMDGEDKYYEAKLQGPIGLVVGSEGKGISRLVKEKCDVLVKIPMAGKVSSLNASVAASILIYEVMKQRSLNI